MQTLLCHNARQSAPPGVARRAVSAGQVRRLGEGKCQAILAGGGGGGLKLRSAKKRSMVAANGVSVLEKETLHGAIPVASQRPYRHCRVLGSRPAAPLYPARFARTSRSEVRVWAWSMRRLHRADRRHTRALLYHVRRTGR